MSRERLEWELSQTSHSSSPTSAISTPESRATWLRHPDPHWLSKPVSRGLFPALHLGYSLRTGLPSASLAGKTHQLNTLHTWLVTRSVWGSGDRHPPACLLPRPVVYACRCQIEASWDFIPGIGQECEPRNHFLSVPPWLPTDCLLLSGCSKTE